MSANVENISQLERRLNISLPPTEIDGEVQNRLKNLARKIKMDGFRPGKVPFKVIAKQYEEQVRREVLGDALQKNFGEVVRAQNLKVAGYPKFEAQESGPFEYIATFEIYPEVTVGDLSKFVLQRPVAQVGNGDVDKTLQIMRKQRATFEPVARASANGDRLTFDYIGRMGGQEFDGGTGTDVIIMLGEGRFLPDFESQLLGLETGAAKTFEIRFPQDYHGKELAGKTATFDIKLKQIAEIKLSPLDAAFAQSLGIEDGDLDKMRNEIKANLERELKQRVTLRLKEQVMQMLLDSTQVEIPKSLVELEIEHLTAAARHDLEARGAKTGSMPLPRDVLEEQAQRRVRLGLILAEVVKANGLHAQPEQIRALVEERAQNYEQPEQVIQWIYQSPQRLRELESAVVEHNVVQWMAHNAKVEDKTITFDELMEQQK
jgi:trigger factor